MTLGTSALGTVALGAGVTVSAPVLGIAVLRRRIEGVQMKHLRKYGEATTIPFSLFEVDGVDLRVDAVYASGDVKITKNEGAEANITTGFVDEGSKYSIAVSATEMEAARISVILIDQTGTKVWLDTTIEIETYGHASAQHAFDFDDAVRGGMTALPNAAADAAGGLTISDAGGLDLDTKLANTNEITAARMGALTDWINGGRLDLLLDAIPTTAMRGTDSAALASVVTEVRLSELDAVTAGKMANQVDIIQGDTTTDIPATIAALNDIAVTDIVSSGAINTLAGAVVNVDLVDVTIANTDMRGTDGANTTAPDNVGIASILADTNELQVDWANGGRLDLLLDQVIADIAAQNDLSAAQVNAEVDDVINTDAQAEISGVPAFNASVSAKINWLFALSRNKGTQTSTTKALRNDGDNANISTSTITDDGTTFTRGKWT